MKLTLAHHRLRSTDELDSLIEERILALQTRLRIEEANVRLEHSRESSPAFCVHVHLVTPGPDVFAEGRDHTVHAAINKVMAEVQRQIGHRTQKRMRRVRANLQTPRWTSADRNRG